MKFKLTIIILLGILLSAPKDGHGQERATEKGIALVLGGGGAKGFAHVGVLKVIDSLGIKVDYIGGTSIGAIVGGLYAAGYSGLQIEEIARSSDWERLMADAVDRTLIPVNEKDFRERYLLTLPVREEAIKAPEGLIQGHNIINHLVALTSQVHQTEEFRNLPTPFFCVITDIENGREIVAESGILPFALRASSSIPMYFAPIAIDGTLYVDGGVTNNFPVDKMRERYAGTIVGVDLQTGLHSADDLSSFTTLLNQLTTLIDYDNYQKNKALCDVYVRPDITGYSILDFSDAVVDSLIVRGEKAMLEEIAQLDHIARRPGAVRTDEALIRRTAETVPYKYLTLEEGSRQDPTYIASMIGLSEEEPTDVASIRHGMNRLYATGQFDYATYTLDPATATVKVYLKEREEFTINIGVNYEEGNSASVLLNVSSGGLLFSRDRFITDIVLAEGPRASINYFIDRGLRPSPTLSFNYTNLRMNYYDEGIKRGYSHTNTLTLSAGLQSSFREKWTWGLSLNAEYYDYYNVLHALDYAPLEPVPFSTTYYTYRLFFGYDSRNSAILHHTGSSLYLGARMPTDNLTTLGSDAPPVTISFRHKVAIGNERLTLLPTIEAALSFGTTPLPFFYKSFIGGLYKPYLTDMHIPMEGMGFAGIISDNAFKAGLEFRSKIKGNHYGSLLLNWLAYGDTFTELPAIDTSLSGGIRYLAITPLGPVQLTVMFISPYKRTRGHVHLGYFF